MGKARRRFTRDFKISVVRMVVDKGVGLVERGGTVGGSHGDGKRTIAGANFAIKGQIAEY